MTKSELIESIARNQKHLPAKDVELAIKHILELMSDAEAEVMDLGSLDALNDYDLDGFSFNG